MADFKRASLIGGRPASSSNVLGRLRNVQIISQQLALPISIIEIILDILPAGDLIRFARTSKRMRDLVYDDARWVKRLKLMDCWNDAEARASVDPKEFDERGIHGKKQGTDQKRASLSRKSRTSTPSVILTDAPGKTNTQLLAETAAGALSPKSVNGEAERYLASEGLNQLDVISNVRSVRGRAREEYGKVYGVLRPYYKDALRVKNPSSAKIFRTYRDPKQQAQMLVQIKTFAKSDPSPGENLRVAQLEAMMSAFEDAVLNEFGQGLDVQDVQGRMAKYANVLVILNGGQRAINQFLTQNSLLQNYQNLGEPSDCVNTNNIESISVEEIHGFCSRLSSATNAQLTTIVRVFPPSVNVIEPFLSRVEANIISPYVNQLLDLCHRRSTEPYLRAVSSSFQQLYQYSRALVLPSDLKAGLLDQFDTAMAEIFSPHFGTYLTEELAFFKRKAETEVTGWERQLSQQDSSIEALYMANVNRQADKRDFLSSFKKVVMMPVNALPSFQMGTKATTTTRQTSGTPERTASPGPGNPDRSSTPVPSNRVSRSPSRPITLLTEPPTTELAAKAAIMKARLEGIGSLFSLEVALSLVHMAKASIERFAVFTLSDNEFAPGARSQAEAIFGELVKILGNQHVRSGFDKAVDHLAAYNPRSTEDRDPEHSSGVAPLAMFLELVNVGDLIQQMLDVFFEQELAATRLTDKQDFLNPALKVKKNFEQMLDERVAAGLNKGIEVLMSEVDYQLATLQRTEDYNPDAAGNSGNLILDVGPSDAACKVVELVSSHTNMLIGSTDKSLLDVFNQEIGLRLYGSFCKHLKRQRVSVTGAIRLISDINHYYAYILTLKNRDLQQYFNALRELSQIYLIGPENAKELATIIADTDRFRGIIRPEEVYEFTERRADWFQIRGRVEKAMYGVGCTIM